MPAMTPFFHGFGDELTKTAARSGFVKIAARAGQKEIRKLILGPKQKTQRLSSGAAKRARKDMFETLTEENKLLKPDKRKSDRWIREQTRRRVRSQMVPRKSSDFMPSEAAQARANRIATGHKMVSATPRSAAVQRAEQLAKTRSGKSKETFEQFAKGKKIHPGSSERINKFPNKARNLDDKGRSRHGALRSAGFTHDADDIGQAVWAKNLGTELKPLGAKGGSPGNESIADLVAHPNFGVTARKIRYDKAAITRGTADRSVKTKDQLADLGLATRTHSAPGHKGKTIIHQGSGHTVRYEDPVFGREAGEWAAKHPRDRKKIMDEQKRILDKVKAFSDKSSKNVADTHGGNILYERSKGGDYKGKVIDILEPPRDQAQLAREAARLTKLRNSKPADRKKYLIDEVHRTTSPDKVGDRLDAVESHLAPKRKR